MNPIARASPHLAAGNVHEEGSRIGGPIRLPKLLPVSSRARQRNQRLFAFWMMETDPAGEEVPVAEMSIDVVLMVVVVLGATE